MNHFPASALKHKTGSVGASNGGSRYNGRGTILPEADSAAGAGRLKAKAHTAPSNSERWAAVNLSFNELKWLYLSLATIRSLAFGYFIGAAAGKTTRAYSGASCS